MLLEMERVFWLQGFRVQASRARAPTVQPSRAQVFWPPEPKRPSAQASRDQASRVQAPCCLESKRPGVQSPSVQSFRVQASSRPESRSPESKRPETKRSELRRPVVQSPSVQAFRAQASSRPESKHPESKRPDHASRVQLMPVKIVLPNVGFFELVTAKSVLITGFFSLYINFSRYAWRYVITEIQQNVISIATLTNERWNYQKETYYIQLIDLLQIILFSACNRILLESFLIKNIQKNILYFYGSFDYLATALLWH